MGLLEDAARLVEVVTGLIRPPHMARIAQINLRARPSLKAKLEKLAKHDRRTLSAYVEKLLEDHVTEQERRRAKQAFKEPTRMRKV